MNEAATPWQRAFRVLVTVGPGGLWLLVFVLIPTLLVLVASFLTRGPYGELTGPWGLHNYVRLMQPVYLEAFAQSLWVGVLATLLSALLGYPLAFYIARHPRRTSSSSSSFCPFSPTSSSGFTPGWSCCSGRGWLTPF